MKKLLLLLAITLSAISYSQKILDNQSIIDLIELNFEEGVIITKIESSDINNETEYTEVENESTLRSETELFQQPTFESLIVSAFKNGNAEKIALKLIDNVELSIDGKEDLYSNSQSELILKTFFLQHKPKDFKLIQKGKSGQNGYFIGELSSDFVYRVTINSKVIKGVNKIISLTIGKGD